MVAEPVQRDRRAGWRGPTAEEGRIPAAATVAVLVAVGLVLRILVARQSLYGDEVATYWDVSSHSLGGLISALHGTHIEITPPLFFVLAWFSRQLGHAPLLLRLPSLIAGGLTIPAVYVLGRRTVGRPAALVACALTALSPFMIYYSAEARAYALLMLLVTLSTLSMLQAIDSERPRWWAAYAGTSCAAVYTHYTCVFYLAGQFLWLLWAHPRAWRAAVLANVAAVIALLPWASAIRGAQSSYTTTIMSDLSPFNLDSVRLYLEHWAIGYPYPGAGGLSGLPGTVALVLLGAGALLALGGLAVRRRALAPVAAGPGPRLEGLDRRLVLVLVLLLAVPIGEAVQSAVGTHVFGVRNLAAAWPPLALAAGAVLVAASPRVRAVAVTTVLVAFAIGGVKTAAGGRWGRPDVQAAAGFLARYARPGDAVIDDSGVTPGPLTGLDTALRRRYRTFRADLPQESEHPFTFGDPRVPVAEAVRSALAGATTGRIAVISAYSPGGQPIHPVLPAGYRVVAQASQPGILIMSERLYARPGTPAG